MDKKVLVITGASKGIGLETIIAALEAGYFVVGTSRNAERLTEMVAARYSQMDHFMAVEMNFDEASIHNAINTIIAKTGRIDVLINNAGYAILGAFEEFSRQEIQANFDVNVFGLFSVTQAVLPQMRQQKSGHIINIASISGTVTSPAQSIYSATKAAVIMMSEALASEVKPLGISVTAICPGGIRTDFLDDRSMKTPEAKIDDYRNVQEMMNGLANLNHNQSGDPALVGKALLEVAAMASPPTRLYLGGGALQGLEHKINQVVASANQYAALSVSIDAK